MDDAVRVREREPLGDLRDELDGGGEVQLLLGDDAAQFWFSKNPDYWAGVIAHEVLHNLGYEHPKGYPGSFINEFGNCVWRSQNTSFSKAPEYNFPERVIEGKFEAH